MLSELSVADLGKMVAGEKTSAELEKEKVEAEKQKFTNDNDGLTGFYGRVDQLTIVALIQEVVFIKKCS